MANNATLVATGKPKIGGAIFCAPLGSKLPTDATSVLDAAFKCLGYCSEDGLTNATNISAGSIRAWGGDTVCNYQDGFSNTEKFKLIEALNVEVLKAVYGDDNVTGDLATGIHIKVTGKERKDCCWVFDLILKECVKRIVVPCAKITAVAEILYKDNAVTGYDTTISATPDAEGAYQHEYIAKAAA